MVEEGEVVKVDGGEVGKLEARWVEVGGVKRVIAASTESLAAWDAASGKLSEEATAKAMAELFNPETGIWSMYLPDEKGNRFGVEHQGVVMTNGGSALRMEGRVLFADAAKRDAGLEICEKLYAQAYAEHGAQLRGLLEKSDAAGPAIRFNLQFSDAELLDSVMRSMLAPVAAPAATGPSGAPAATAATGPAATPPPESPAPPK